MRRGRGKQGAREPGKQVSINCLPGYLAARDSRCSVGRFQSVTLNFGPEAIIERQGVANIVDVKTAGHHIGGDISNG